MAREKVKRIIPYAVIVLVSAYLYFLAGQFGFVAKAGNLGPDFWPKLLLGLTMAVCLYEIVKTALFSPGAAPGKKMEGATDEGPRRYTGLLLIGTVLTIAYVYFVTLLGFILCTFIYLALFMTVGRYRKFWVIAANSLIGTVLFALIFMKVVYVSLPLGEGPFQKFSLLFLTLLGIK